MIRSVYISFLCLSLLSSVQAQDKKYVYRDSSILQTDEIIDSAVPVEKIVEAPVGAGETYPEERIDTTLYPNNLVTPADSVKQWKELKDFAYVKYLDSMLKAKKEEAKHKEKDDSYSPRTSLLDRLLSSRFTQILLWTLAGLFILFIIYRLFMADGAFRRKSRSLKTEEPTVEEENISGETDFDALISQSLKNNNYRQAIRYQYLKTLHTLAGKQLLELAADKTNYQYVREMKKLALQNEFASLTLNYEYVWYGEFAIEREIYYKLERYFSTFNQKL